MSSGCFVVLLLETCPFVLQVLSTPFVHFLMGLIVCAAVIKMEMAMEQVDVNFHFAVQPLIPSAA